MTSQKRDLVPVEEVVRRYDGGRGERIEAITRDLRTRGLEISQATVRSVLRDVGVAFTQRRRGAKAAEHLDVLTALAHDAGVHAGTLRKAIRQYEGGSTLSAAALTMGKPLSEAREIMAAAGTPLHDEDDGSTDDEGAV
ncbi:hypothetical protein ACFQ6U_13825 [Streptomyces sp. NPDC056465]|uniref:hypothetical protein n=1 Tax=Streptomyces sp. NPDC056465 TaxID=3345829 RepID=UPI0036D04ABB